MADEAKELKHDGDKPIVRVLSAKQALEANKAQRRLAIASNQLTIFQMEGKSDLAELEALEAVADQATANYRQTLVKAVVYIPRDWLVEDAPNDLKWESHEDMDWIKVNKIRKVFNLIQGLQEEAEQTAKN